jgi:N-acylneuraminate cytidylyltransferase
VTCFAFVFARGGSKGLPGKNVRPLAGVPLLGHAVMAAKESRLVSGVFVSTDCDEIAEVGRQYGAEVIRRPAELATDTAAEWLAWKHAVEHVRQQHGDFEVFLSLPATSPLRIVQDVDQCVLALDASTDAVVTVTEAFRNPYFNMVKREDGGETEILLRGEHVRRQDAPRNIYDLTTVAYATRPDYVLAQPGLFAGRVRSVIVPRHRAVDIDDIYDFLTAEALFPYRANGV